MKNILKMLLSLRSVYRTLVFFNKEGTEIKEIGCCIAEMDDERLGITVMGIAYPFYEEEFEHHVRAYRERFKSN